MSLEAPKPRFTVYVILQEYLGRGRTGKSRSLAVYGIPLEEAYERVKQAFEEEA